MTAAVEVATPAVDRSALDRALDAYPVVVGYLGLFLLYAWQTTKHPTPWLFTDELQWAKQSLAVAHHGRPQLRGHDVGFGSLYNYFIAPAWWLGATGPGYAAAKYLNSAVMAASIFPGYALARLFVPRWAALAAGAATASIPAAAYAGMLIPESLAYAASTLALWLLARALLSPSRGSIALGCASIALAVAIRSQLTVLIPAAVLAAVIMVASGPGGRGLIRFWTWRERVGVALLCLCACAWLGAVANHHSYSWQIGTYFHDRMFTYGLWAFGAFTIGVGVLPALAALLWLLSTRLRGPDERALAATLLAVLAGFGLYTAVKASYISTIFAVRVEERNLIYLSPLVFAAAARWLVSGRARLLPTALAAGAVGYLLDSTPYHNDEHFYSDAPGLSILQWLNRTWYWSTDDARRLLFGILIGGVTLALLRELAHRRPRSRTSRALPVLAGSVTAAVLGWNLTGEIAGANASNAFAHDFRAVLPTPPDWIDRTTGRARTLFIGQSLSGSNAFWSLEFWNQSIQDVWSVDASAPGPGPTTTPDLAAKNGRVLERLPVDWAVTSPGVDLVGRVQDEAGGLRLVRLAHPLRIASAQGGISPDGWMSTSAWYDRYVPARRGLAIVTLSRTAACGDVPPSHITIRLSDVNLVGYGQPTAGRLKAVRRRTIRSTPCDSVEVRIPARPPFQIDVTARGTFQPSQYDLRRLSAQVGFAFQPAER